MITHNIDDNMVTWIQMQSVGNNGMLNSRNDYRDTLHDSLYYIWRICNRRSVYNQLQKKFIIISLYPLHETEWTWEDLACYGLGKLR